MVEARTLLNFAGLVWNGQTDAFLRMSTCHCSRDRYYSVLKDTNRVVGRWRSELSDEVQRAVMAIVGRSRLGTLYAGDVEKHGLSDERDLSNGARAETVSI